jgi:hypothetical protein
MMGLFRRFKDPFNLPLAFPVTPGTQQIAYCIKLEDILKLHRVWPLQDTIQWDIENRMGRPHARLNVGRFDLFCSRWLHSSCLRQLGRRFCSLRSVEVAAQITLQVVYIKSIWY